MPALALSTVDTAPTENTGVLVERLWEATSETLSDVEDWHRPLETTDSDPGRRWWPWLIAGVSIALAVFAVWAVPNAVRQRDAAGAAAIDTEVAAAAADLNTAASVAAVVLDPGADPAALSGVSVDLTRLDTAARSLLDEAVAAEELGLEYADQLGQAGELALVLERRLSVVVTYRLLVESSFQLPELPAVLGTDELGDQARILSEALTSIRDDMDSLPSDPLLDTHRLTVDEAVASLEATQSEYLAALRDGNEASADLLRGQMLTTVGGVHSELDDLLGTLQPWVDETIEGINGNLPN